MTAWQRIFASPDVVQIEAQIGRQILECERVNAKAIRLGATPPLEAKRRALLRVAQTNRRALNELAARTAANATARIRERLAATAVRPGTGVQPHLASLIVSRPLLPNTGSVGVASEARLNRAINPHTPGYGPYWRAQEYGTGSPEVPSQVGRQIFGLFYGPGATGGSRPQSQYSGGGGPHPIFIPGGRGPRGGAGGKGVISVEIQARHFIRDGADLAAAEWQREMRRLDRRAASALRRARAVRPTARALARRRPPGRRR
jgi:hypothetical protein